MGRGRFITNAISKDKRINQLSDDTSRLGFTWLITFADREGRTYGDPAIVRSMLFPRREDISIRQMEGYIREWADLKLVVWYEADGDLYIYFPAFEKNQTGMRKNREPASHIPEPPGYVPPAIPQSTDELPEEPDDIVDEMPEDIRQSSGNHPAECPVKLIKEKLREVSPDGESEPEPEEQAIATPPAGMVKNPRALAAMANFEARRNGSNTDWSWLPSYLLPLAEAFTSATDIRPLKTERKFWIRSLGELDEKGIQPEVVPKAVKKMQKDGLTIKSPASIGAIAYDIQVAQPKRQEVFREEWR